MCHLPQTYCYISISLGAACSPVCLPVLPSHSPGAWTTWCTSISARSALKTFFYAFVLWREASAQTHKKMREINYSCVLCCSCRQKKKKRKRSSQEIKKSIGSLNIPSGFRTIMPCHVASILDHCIHIISERGTKCICMTPRYGKLWLPMVE